MKNDPLLESFAARQPRELAALLADADAQEICELLRLLPTETRALLAAHLPSRQLSLALKLLAPAEIGSLLLNARHEDAISLLSLLPESRYAEILKASPSGRQAALRRLFHAPFESLGSLASPNYIRANIKLRCEEFAEHPKSHEEEPLLPIYAVDDAGVFHGEINPIAVIARKNQKLRLQDIAQGVTPLSGQMSAPAALKSRQWSRHQNLPVVDGKGRLLGTVQRHSLLKYVPKSRTESFGLERMLIEVTGSYFDFCERILKLLFAGKIR